MTTRRRLWLTAAASLLASPLLTVPAWAQAWPGKTIRLVSVFPPGGSVDQVARLVVIAPPQQGGALAGHAISHVRSQRVVRQNNFARHSQMPLGNPTCIECFITLGPLDYRGFIGCLHAYSRGDGRVGSCKLLWTRSVPPRWPAP